MKSAIQNIPDELIYEMVKGKPIYYKGYLDVLSGQKQLQEILKSWETHNWDKDISILNDIRFNIQQIIDED